MSVDDALIDDESSKAMRDHARRILEGVLGIPGTEGNLIEVLRNGDEIFPRMLEETPAAHHRFPDFRVLEGFRWRAIRPSIGRTREGRLTRSCPPRRVGAQSIEPRLLDLMTDAQVKWFRPLRKIRPREVNHRTHRKILVVDETIGFTGGVGISDLWRGEAQRERMARHAL